MQTPNGWYRLRLLFLGVLLLCSAPGCISRRTSWLPPLVADPLSALAFSAPGQGSSSLSMAEAEYAAAMQLEASGDASCVDHYYRAATMAWPDIAGQLNQHGVPYGRAGELYESALIQLISTGQRFQRFDPRRGLTVQSSAGWLTVPTSYHGFVWPPADFDHLVPVGDYSTKKLNRFYCCAGLGVATIGVHCRSSGEMFRRPQQVVAATAILRPTASSGTATGPFALELFDPLRISSVRIAGHSRPLRRDITAPIVYRLKDEDRSYVEAFLQPGATSNNMGLFMIEPYQPGKIPVLLVHGLLSDPFTWANIANEIRGRPDLMERYQIWGFEYATGEPFLSSAALLRRQLQEVRALFDPTGLDPALSQMVLIGHSMGGLVAKLQVTYSGDTVWQSVSNRPFDTLVTVPDTRRKLAEAFFFDPSPHVSRVVYVGTPHLGSPWARRPIGRWGSSLVEEPSSMEAEHQQLVRDNPYSFSLEFTRRVPTSIDLLRPDSDLLQAIDRVPVAGHVRFHSIIGSFRPMIGAGDSDGVVPVASARKPGVVSEKLIPDRHVKLHQSQEGIDELMRILRTHLWEFDAMRRWSLSHRRDDRRLSNSL